MKTLERESGPDLWFKIKNILDLFVIFYYLLEVKLYEVFSVWKFWEESWEYFIKTI